MATDATFNNQLQALATATANFADGKDAAIKNTIITALGGSTPSSGGSGKTEGIITYNDDTRVIQYNGDGTLYKQSGESEPITITSGSEHELGMDDMYFFATATDNYTAAVLIVE